MKSVYDKSLILIIFLDGDGMNRTIHHDGGKGGSGWGLSKFLQITDSEIFS